MFRDASRCLWCPQGWSSSTPKLLWMRLKWFSARDALFSSQIAPDPLLIPCLCVPLKSLVPETSLLPHLCCFYWSPRLSPVRGMGRPPCMPQGCTPEMTTLFLEIPLTPVEVEGGETRRIPFSQRERKAPFLTLWSPFWGAEVTGAAVLSPTWHPDNYREEAESLFPAHVSAGTAGSWRARGVPCSQRWLRYPQERCTPNIRDAPFGAEPAAGGSSLCQETGWRSPDICCGDQGLEGSPTGWDHQHPLPALRHAPVGAKPAEHARRQGSAVGQHPQHPLPGVGALLLCPTLCRGLCPVRPAPREELTLG